jgi:hypothetical protein
MKTNDTFRYVLMLLLFLTPGAFVWGSPETMPEAISGNGLEAIRTTPLDVLVEDVSDDAKKIGLSKEGIEACVNRTLRQAGITPGGPRDFAGAIFVNINVVGDSFTISISFKRPVFYSRGDKWFRTVGATWDQSVTGTHGRDGRYILDNIANQLEVFCNEFLKANGK